MLVYFALLIRRGVQLYDDVEVSINADTFVFFGTPTEALVVLLSRVIGGKTQTFSWLILCRRLSLGWLFCHNSVRGGGGG